MIPGLSGSLLSHDAVGGTIDATSQSSTAEAHRRVRAWHTAVASELGPASSARAVYDRIAAPLGAALGFRVVPAHGPADAGEPFRAVLEARGSAVAGLLATAWGRDPAAAWREGVRHGIGTGVRWCFCVTGPVLRVFDARRTYSRRFAEFDLEIAIGEPAGFTVLWRLLNADGFARSEPALDRAVALSEQYRADVRACLQQGVHDALTSLLRAFASAPRARRAPRQPAMLLDESLIVVYRILFLLFAEARGLVPKWHPTYRDSYTIESLRAPIERLARPPGLWQSLQAIARLAHRGCRAGTLRVPPFNGRLFSPAHAPLAESLELDDGAVRDAMVALTTKTARGGRQRIAYADLGVEQLGGVYERILDYEPVASPGDRPSLTLVRAGRRKATGTFYTPRALTEFIVRRALSPLVDQAGARRDPVHTCSRPSHGQRRIPCRGLPLPRVRVRIGPDSRRYAFSLRRRRGRSRGISTGSRPAMPVRRGHQSHGSAARTPVVVACHAGGRPPADVSGSSSARRKQHRRRIARGRPPPASLRAGHAKPPRAPATLRSRSGGRGNRDSGRTSALPRPRSGRHHRASAREGTPFVVAATSWDAARSLESRGRSLVRRVVSPGEIAAPAGDVRGTGRPASWTQRRAAVTRIRAASRRGSGDRPARAVLPLAARVS